MSTTQHNHRQGTRTGSHITPTRGSSSQGPTPCRSQTQGTVFNRLGAQSSGSVVNEFTRSLFRDFRPVSIAEYNMNENSENSQINLCNVISQILAISIVLLGEDIKNHRVNMCNSSNKIITLMKSKCRFIEIIMCIKTMVVRVVLSGCDRCSVTNVDKENTSHDIIIIIDIQKILVSILSCKTCYCMIKNILMKV